MASIKEYQALIKQYEQEKTRLEFELSSVQSNIRESLQLLKDMGFSSLAEAQAKREQYKEEFIPEVYIFGITGTIVAFITLIIVGIILMYKNKAR